jgi:glutaredoxin-like protein NrdH
MTAQDHEVMVYGLTTCRWCSRTKLWFEDAHVPFRRVDVDSLTGAEVDAVIEEVERVSGGRRFPVTVIDGEVIVGFKPEEFESRINGPGAKSGE